MKNPGKTQSEILTQARIRDFRFGSGVRPRLRVRQSFNRFLTPKILKLGVFDRECAGRGGVCGRIMKKKCYSFNKSSKLYFSM